MNNEHIPAPLPTQHHPTTDLLSMIPLPQSPPPPFIAAIANNPHAIATTEVSSTSFEPFVPTLKYNDGRWSEEETRLFEEGLRLYPRNNKKISALVGTRSVTQVMAKKEYRGKKARKAQETAAAAATNTIVQPTLQPAFQPFQIRQGEECPGCIPGSGKIKGHRGMHKRQGGRYNMPSQTSYTPPHPPIYVPPPQSMAYAPPQTPMFAAYNSFNQSQSYYVPPPNPPQISRLTANEDEFGRRLAETMNYEMTDEVDDDDDWVQVDVDEDVDVYHERDRAYLRHCLRNASFWNVPPKVRSGSDSSLNHLFSPLCVNTRHVTLAPHRRTPSRSPPSRAGASSPPPSPPASASPTSSTSPPSSPTSSPSTHSRFRRSRRPR